MKTINYEKLAKLFKASKKKMSVYKFLSEKLGYKASGDKLTKMKKALSKI